MIRRRNSASDRLSIPICDDKKIQRFKVDDNSVTESTRAKMVKTFEKEKQKQAEWRSLHQSIIMQPEDADPKKKSKRAKSDIKRIQDSYISTVTRVIEDEQEK